MQFTGPMQTRSTRLPAALLMLTLGILPASAQGIRPTTVPEPRPTSRPESQPASRPATTNEFAGGGFARRLEKTHGAMAWPKDKVLRSRIKVTFGDQTMIEGTMTFEHPSGRCRIETAEAVTVFDGERAWVQSKTDATPMDRFHLLTWPYFVAAPLKLRDPGSHLEGTGLKTMIGRLCETARLTFDSGVGDTPEDWYVVYMDPGSGRLLALSYIVTYGTPAADAEKTPHAAVYRDFATVDEVVLPTLLTFHDWDETKGAHETKLGEARLEGLQFVDPAPDTFARPEDAVEAPLP